jgi:hypothetical protein
MLSGLQQSRAGRAFDGGARCEAPRICLVKRGDPVPFVFKLAAILGRPVGRILRYENVVLPLAKLFRASWPILDCCREHFASAESQRAQSKLSSFIFFMKVATCRRHKLRASSASRGKIDASKHRRSWSFHKRASSPDGAVLTECGSKFARFGSLSRSPRHCSVR